MTSPPANDRLEIEVQDFGPIVHAKLDLRPMTVFVGPSNTGKSYLAVLIYALHRSFGASDDGRAPGFHRFESTLLGTEYTVPLGLPCETITAFEQLAKSTDNAIAGIEGINLTLPEGIQASMRELFEKLAGVVSTEMLRCFGMNRMAPLTRNGSKGPARVAVRLTPKDDVYALEHKLAINAENRNMGFQTSIPQRINLSAADINQDELTFASRYFRRVASLPSANVRPFEYMSAIVSLMGLVAPGMVGALHSPAFYFPTDRAGVINTHGSLVAAMLSNAPIAGLRQTTGAPMLSGVLADFLRQLLQVDQNPYHQPTDSHDAGRQIEKAILRGTIGVERSQLINYPNFTYRPDGWKEDLPLMHASSMVSELAPVVLYLRHLVQPGNVLIIEEPESHLHPAAQVELTRQLAKLVQRGYRVIITTHSEWILEELANVVQRSQLQPEELTTVSESDAALTADQVGVWLFRQKRRPRGSEVVQITLDDSGLYPSDFNDVAIALGNDSAKIFNHLGAR